MHIKKPDLGGEYSWNIDGTRHDNHRFPDNEKWINKAKEFAAEELGIPSRSLNFIYSSRGGAWYRFESFDEKFSTYIHKQKTLYVFEVPKGVLLVII